MIALEEAEALVDRGGWVGRTPISWMVGPLRRFCSITLGKMVASDSAENARARPYLRAAHVQPGGVLTLVDVKEMPFTPEEASKLDLEVDDVVVVEGGAGFGRSAVLREKLAGWGFQNSINRVRPFSGSGRFTNYALLAAQHSGYFQSLINMATIPHLTAEKLADVQIAWPEKALQLQIADYLDAQTAKIDLLIEKQERLIETLAERRQAVISNAVTNGLDPSVPRKESAVEWLAEIPIGWRAARVAHNYSVVLGKMVNEGKDRAPDARLTPYLRAGNVQPYGVDITEVKSMPTTAKERADLSLKRGDLVVVEGGQGGYGRSALVREDLSGWVFQNHIMRVRSNVSASNGFLDYVLKSLRSAGYIASLSSHASLPSFSAEKLAAVRYGMPPLDEQFRIVQFLDRETAQMDALAAKAREMIDVLKERRQALISAAVTGKIDVRGLS